MTPAPSAGPGEAPMAYPSYLFTLVPGCGNFFSCLSIHPVFFHTSAGEGQEVMWPTPDPPAPPLPQGRRRAPCAPPSDTPPGVFFCDTCHIMDPPTFLGPPGTPPPPALGQEELALRAPCLLPTCGVLLWHLSYHRPTHISHPRLRVLTLVRGPGLWWTAGTAVPVPSLLPQS